jgi:AcrR family transcriptional regulator
VTDDRPYHHGRLRAVLLAEAERTLREQGIDALSLRDLARQAGVSHAAPRRHFADRQALLEALAEAGFIRLGDEVRAAIDQAGEDYQAGLRAVATAYVRFAIQDAALLQLMFTIKNDREDGALPEASTRLFAAASDLIGFRLGSARSGARPGPACCHPASPIACCCFSSPPCRASPPWSARAGSSLARRTRSSPMRWCSSRG